jgi:hypothetical protein
MTGRTHRLVSGSTAWVGVVAVGAPAYLALGAAAVASLTASLPDVDQKVGWLPHRGPTHWPLVQLLVLAPCGRRGLLVSGARSGRHRGRAGGGGVARLLRALLRRRHDRAALGDPALVAAEQARIPPPAALDAHPRRP